MRQSSVMNEPALRFAYDDTADAAYVSLQPSSADQPSVEATTPATASINLDYNGDGQLVGIEILAARKNLHPAAVRLGHLDVEEWQLLLGALNEVLHGPEAIEPWEFQTRIGHTRDAAVALLKRFTG